MSADVSGYPTADCTPTDEAVGAVDHLPEMARGGAGPHTSVPSASGRDVPRPLPRAERALTSEQRKLLSLQIEQDADLLLERPSTLPPMPFALARQQ